MQTPGIIFAVRPSANILKGVQLTLSHICISVLVLYQHDDLFGDFVIIIRNVLLFPTHLMCTRHSISEKLSNYYGFSHVLRNLFYSASTPVYL